MSRRRPAHRMYSAYAYNNVVFYGGEDGPGVEWFIDPNNGSDVSGWGITAEKPLASLEYLWENGLVSSYDRILLYPGTHSYSLETNDYDTGPNYVEVIGCGHTPYATAWESGAADAPCLDLKALGWRIRNIKFTGPTAEACIKLHCTDSGANDIAIRTQIIENVFYGNTTGLYGINVLGSPYLCDVVDNYFEMFHQGDSSAHAIRVTNTTYALPYRWLIAGNHFMENDNHVFGGMNACRILNNVFQKAGKAYSATTVLSTEDAGGDGNNNIVTGNVMPGDFSVAGGYIGAATDFWGGNYADDTAEAEVDASGFTVAVPS